MRQGQKYPAELLEPGELGALVRACGLSRTGRRNRALIALLAGCGLRVSEALSLEPRDVSFQRYEVRVRKGKGSKARTVTLDATTEALVEQWLTVRPSEAKALLSTSKGEPVQASYVRAMLPRLAKRAGVAKRVHAHGLRHYFACSLDRDGYPIAQISTLLGHTSTSQTATYLERLRGVDRITAKRLRERTWIA